MCNIHFFDIDHTVTSSVTSVQYLFTGIRKKIFPIRPFLSVPRLMWKYRAGKFSIDHLYKDGIPFLLGKKRETLVDLAGIAFNKQIRRSIFPGALKTIRELIEKGDRVIGATSSIDIVVEPLFRFLGIQEFICSSLEFDKEICTGKFHGQPAFEEEKKRLVMKYIRENGLDSSKCYFYSDSIHDLPLLEEVGHPVVVNPDRKLKRIAREKNWQILKF